MPRWWRRGRAPVWPSGGCRGSLSVDWVTLEASVRTQWNRRGHSAFSNNIHSILYTTIVCGCRALLCFFTHMYIHCTLCIYLWVVNVGNVGDEIGSGFLCSPTHIWQSTFLQLQLHFCWHLTQLDTVNTHSYVVRIYILDLWPLWGYRTKWSEQILRQLNVVVSCRFLFHSVTQNGTWTQPPSNSVISVYTCTWIKRQHVTSLNMYV